jgi:ABC-type branched-subunit amino acid transport system substrate-binding protein
LTSTDTHRIRRNNFRRATLTAGTALAAALLAAGCAGTAVSSNSSAAGTGAGASPASGSGATAGALPASAPGWDPSTKTITVTSLYPESGPVAGGALFLVGMKAWFSRATAPGGQLAGYKINMNEPDTQYEDSLTISEYQEYKNESALFEVLATPTMLPLAQDDILAVGAGLDSTLIHDPNYLPVLPPNEVIAANMVAYADQVEGKKSATYCVAQENDSTGSEFAAGTAYAAKQLGLKYGGAIPYTYPPTDATPIVVQARSKNCGVVVVGGVTPTMIDIAARAAQLNYDPQWLVSGSGVSPHMATGPSGSYIQKNVLMVYTGADWGSTELAGSQQLATDVKAVDPTYTPDAVSYESGYCEGMATTDVLAHALKDGDMSRAGILKAANQLGNVSFLGLCGGGYNYGTSAATRIPPRTVSVFDFVPNTVTGLKVVKLNYTSKVGNSVPLTAS